MSAGDVLDYSIPLDKSKWSLEKIKFLVKSTFDENENLEYLSQAWKDREDTEKKLCSFANTNGGVVVFGVKENRSKDKRQLLESLELVGVKNKPNYDIQIGRIYGRAIPPISADITKFLLDNGNIVIVLIVKKSIEGPVQAGNGKYYIRIQSESKTMNRDTLRNLFLERDLFVQRRKALLFEIDLLINGIKEVLDVKIGPGRIPRFGNFEDKSLKEALVLNHGLHTNAGLMNLFFECFREIRLVKTWKQDYQMWTILKDINKSREDERLVEQLYMKAEFLKDRLEMIKRILLTE